MAKGKMGGSRPARDNRNDLEQEATAPVDAGSTGDTAEGAATPMHDAVSREERIRLAAYALSERRGFSHGGDVDDWLEAERQIDAKPTDRSA